MKHILHFLLTASLFILLVSSVSAQNGPGEILNRVLERGALRCGVNPSLLGFSSQDDNGNWIGFDVDICRAVAAAILGDADAVEYVPVNAADRQLALELGEFDMLSRNTTLTLTRDTDWGARFGPVTFYDGQGLMVFRESGITNLDILAGGSICVETDTTTESNMREILTLNEMPYRLYTPDGSLAFESPASSTPTTTIRTYFSAQEMLDAFFAGFCDAVTTDRSGLAARRAASENPEAISILDLTLSEEPLAPLSPDSDPDFANVIAWTVFGLIQAEEFGITAANVEEMAVDPSPQIAAFLGTGGTQVGDYLDIPNDFMFQVISQVGNYEEIYERHLGPDTALGLDRGLNRLWTDGGLLYSPPFR